MTKPIFVVLALRVSITAKGEKVMDWQPIPSEADRTKPPFDGSDVLIWADSGCVNIVRLAWWNPGGIVDHSTGEIFDPAPEDEGWWSYNHSVTQEQLSYLNPTYWAPFEQPAPLMDEVSPGVMRR